MFVIEMKPYVATFTIDYDTYMAALQKGIFIPEARLKEREFVYKKTLQALTREKAVNSICQWYWKVFKGTWGQAHQILTVSDPYSEVRYTENFSCAEKMNRYLDEHTILLLLKESNGELIREIVAGEKHHPTNSVRRVKRRRKYLKKIAHNLYQHPTTHMLYYAATVVPQKSLNGKIIQKRKRENFKLNSKDMDKAHKEIERRFGRSSTLADDLP